MLPSIAALDRRLHDRSSFDSGEPSLDRWLRENAGQAMKQDSARTYVICDEANRVMGYYSLCAFQVESAVAPKRIRVGSYPVPAVLLARLAVDRSQQGLGLGGYLLLDALGTAAAVAAAVGARVMVVHALHDPAAQFYRKYGFQAFETDPLSLYLPMQDIRATLAAGLTS